MDNINRIEILNNPKANNDGKRLVAKFSMADGKVKTTKFGMYKSAGTFADGSTKEKRDAYISRHSKLNENWNKTGLQSAGFLSRWVLWEDKDNSDIKNKLKSITGIKNISVNFKRIKVK